MEYRIIWSAFSEQQIDEIFSFYKQKTKSYVIASRIIKRILLAPNILTYNPKLGQIENLLKDKELEYRYIVESNYKIIYTIDEEKKFIKILDIFDTRQNPEKINRKK